MPLDRFGNKVALGWSRSETLWILAAMTLAQEEQKAAFRDISEMRGCSFYAVVDKARRIRLGRADRAIQSRVLSVTVMVPVGRKLPPSSILGPSKAQLMGGR